MEEIIQHDEKGKEELDDLPQVVLAKSTSSTQTTQTMIDSDVLMQPSFKKLLKHGKTLVGQKITVAGWARSVRAAEKKTILFLQLSDGSCHKDLQVIVRQSDFHEQFDEIATGNIGWCFEVTGEIVSSPGEEQAIEILADRVKILGKTTDAKQYPLQKRGKEERKKGIPVERLRKLPHLRGRTYLFGAIFRLRNKLAMATHAFFQEQECIWVSAPIITFSDCEGAGEAFLITTEKEQKSELEKAVTKTLAPHSSTSTSPVDSGAGASATAHVTPVDPASSTAPIVSKEQHPYEHLFFRDKAYLTVSGQLEGESVACGMTRIYTFGPTFRAEESDTSRHLSEFWMVEPEIAFIKFQELMTVAERYVQFCIQAAIDECSEEIEFLSKTFGLTSLEDLSGYARKPFVRLSYTDAVQILQDAKFPVTWGDDLCSDYEKYLTDVHFKHPVIAYGYPEHMKAFYMKPSGDGKTVQSFDVLVPTVGELIGGSIREEDYFKLKSKMESLGMDIAPYTEYLELREFGTCPHGGFGLGFERLIRFVGGIPNIRDCIFYPRAFDAKK